MASVNPLSRELVFKIVYYGPGLGGKTTTLEYLHATAKPEHRGKLVSLATPVDRTLYFDFLPVRLPPVRGMNVRLQLFTVPGQVYFNATRKLVLTGADGIVFVSDSQIVRADANLESLENLRENLAEQGRDLSQVPLVFQHNKRDLPDLLPLEELDEMLNPFDAVSLPASAKTGLGVYEGLEEISARVLRAFEQRLPDTLGSGLGASFDAVEGGLVMALRDASPSATSDVTVARVSPAATAWPSMPPDTTLGDPPSEEEDDLVVPGSDPDELLPPPPAQDHLLDIAQPEDAKAAAEHDAMFQTLDGIGPPIPGLDEGRIRSLVGLDLPEPPAPAAPARLADPRAPWEPEPLLDEGVPPSLAAGVLAPTAGAGVSFVVLWPRSERQVVAQIEAALSAARYAYAIEQCDALVGRLLSSAADLFGSSQAPRDPAVVPLLLGLDGRRYLGFRSTVLKARSGGDVTARDALAAFAFAIAARIAQASIGA